MPGSLTNDQHLWSRISLSQRLDNPFYLASVQPVYVIAKDRRNAIDLDLVRLLECALAPASEQVENPGQGRVGLPEKLQKMHHRKSKISALRMQIAHHLLHR